MALIRGKDYMLDPPKPPREKHKCIPVVGEFGRYMVASRTLAKRGREGAYIVDVLAVEETNSGPVTGTCPCKGWQIRKTCSHLEDAREEHERVIAGTAAEDMGFEKL